MNNAKVDDGEDPDQRDHGLRPTQGTEERLLSGNRSPWKHRPLLCHPEWSWAFGPPKWMKNAFRPATALHGSVALPFVIPSVAEGSAVPRTLPGYGRTNRLYVWILILLSGSNLTAGSQSPVRLTPVSKANLCVTEGTIEQLPGQRLSVNVAKMRAYVNAYTQPLAEVRFTYLGGTSNEAPLASGEMRRQFGLKLRAQDACNLVYAMWRIEPESKLVVSVKSNPGQHTSAQCGNRGYKNMKPSRSVPVPALRPGDTHTLRAEMNGAQMRVFADKSLVWEGSVSPDALAFDGPAGVRSDNARLQFDFATGPPLKQQAPGCRGQESE